MFTQLVSDLTKPLTNLKPAQTYVFVFLLISVLTAIWYYHKVGRKAYYLRKLPGIPRYPILGNANILTNGLFRPLPPDPSISKIIITLINLFQNQSLSNFETFAQVIDLILCSKIN